MPDNLDPAGTPDNQDQGGGAGAADAGSGAAPATWKSGLSADLKGAPFLQKFEDTPEGLTKAFESYGNLEKLLGHEKVPIPKGPEDTEGWARFSKALGIPDKAAEYGLPDVKLPDAIKGSAIDKSRFAEIVHAHKLTPDQAKGLWKVYNEIGVEQYSKAQQEYQTKMTESINRLKGEWGDAYDANVELGQLVINKFSADQDENDFVTAVLSSDPRGIKFLAKIGEQFAENKVGEFQMKRFSLAPEEAQSEIDKLVRDLDGPYMNQKNKFSDAEHTAAMDRVNALRAMINRAKGQA
jgi:hypothetical protein